MKSRTSMPPLDDAQSAEKDIVQELQVILSKHNISTSEWGEIPPEWLDNLAVCLQAASRNESVSNAWDRVNRLREKLRRERIEALEKLLSTYENPIHRIATRKGLRDRYQLLAERSPRAVPRYAADLDTLLRQMSHLLTTEKLIEADVQLKKKDKRRKGGRPKTAKMESAEAMICILTDAGVVTRNNEGRWKAAAIIADMFKAADIEKRLAQTVQKDIYESSFRSATSKSTRSAPRA